VLALSNWAANNADAFIAAIDRNGIAAVYFATRMVVAGGLIGLGVDVAWSFLQAGAYAGRILNGADPGSLPVLSPRTELTVNLRTAAAQGISIPVTLLAIADTVTE